MTQRLTQYEGTKTCKVCCEVKPLSAFSSSKEWIRSICKDCRNSRYKKCKGPIPTEKIYFESKFVKTAGCWEWNGFITPYGYGVFSFLGKQEQAHRASYRLYVEEIPDGLFVCHHCDNRRCVNPAHFFIGTQADNLGDARIKGRWKGRKPNIFGEAHHKAKLKIPQVIEIRRLCDGRLKTQKEIAKEFGISHNMVSLIGRRQNWKSV